MQVQLFKNVADAQPSATIQCTGFEARSIDPYEHEVIADNANYNGAVTAQRLISVSGRDRQGTSPLVCAKAVVLADDGSTVLWQADISGAAVITADAAPGELVIDDNDAGVNVATDGQAVETEELVQPPQNQ